MILKKEGNFESNLNHSDLNEEIEFKQIFDFFKRNKKPLAIYGLIGILTGGIVAFSSKKVWHGEFQIVLRLNEESLNIQKPNLNLGFGLGNKFDPLETEVGILKSPSVLMEKEKSSNCTAKKYFDIKSFLSRQ